jgi:hypothetical protein
MANVTLHSAKHNKLDEFYTQLVDIEDELKRYKDQLRNKVVLCNCDDPYESNFFKFFASNFNALGLKKLIATSYVKSPIVGGQVPLFEIEGLKPSGKEPYKIEINEVPDLNHDGAISLDDVEHLLKHDKNVATPLKGDSKHNAGDFRSVECVDLLKQADIVITNPPFSLFREFISLLMKHKKKFIIIGNKNAITYKEVFTHIKDNEMWLGYRNINSDMWLKVPEGEKFEKIVEGVKLKHIMACWYTNLETSKRHQKMMLYKPYIPEEYPKYDNFDAIDVGKVAEIPADYAGSMGVPITYLDKHNPDQFEIIKFRKGNDEKDLAINGKTPYFRILIKRKDIK